jgi:hypothetical protein
MPNRRSSFFIDKRVAEIKSSQDAAARGEEEVTQTASDGGSGEVPPTPPIGAADAPQPEPSPEQRAQEEERHQARLTAAKKEQELAPYGRSPHGLPYTLGESQRIVGATSNRQRALVLQDIHSKHKSRIQNGEGANGEAKKAPTTVTITPEQITAARDAKKAEDKQNQRGEVIFDQGFPDIQTEGPFGSAHHAAADQEHNSGKYNFGLNELWHHAKQIHEDLRSAAENPAAVAQTHATAIRGLADRIERKVPGHSHVANLRNLANTIDAAGAAMPKDTFEGPNSVQNRLVNIGSKLASIRKLMDQKEGPVDGNTKESYVQSPTGRAAQGLSEVYKSLANEHQTINGGFTKASPEYVRSVVGGIRMPVSRMFIEVLRRRATALGSEKTTPMGNLTSASKMVLTPLKMPVSKANATLTDQYATLEDTKLVLDKDGKPRKYPKGHINEGKYMVTGSQRVDPETKRPIVFQGVKGAPKFHVIDPSTLPVEQRAFVDHNGNATDEAGRRYREGDSATCPNRSECTLGPHWNYRPSDGTGIHDVTPHPTHFWNYEQNDSLDSRVDVGPLKQGRLE